MCKSWLFLKSACPYGFSMFINFIIEFSPPAPDENFFDDKDNSHSNFPFHMDNFLANLSQNSSEIHFNHNPSINSSESNGKFHNQSLIHEPTMEYEVHYPTTKLHLHILSMLIQNASWKFLLHKHGFYLLDKFNAFGFDERAAHSVIVIKQWMAYLGTLIFLTLCIKILLSPLTL